MKILIITAGPTFGGTSTANMLIAKSIASLGHTVYLNDEFYDYNDTGSVKVTKIPVHWRANPDKVVMRRKIMELKPDIIIWGSTAPLMSCIFDILYFKVKGVKQFAIFHSLSFTSGIKTKIFELICASSIIFLDKLIFVSSFTQKSWSKYFTFRLVRRKSHVIYNPIELPKSCSVRTPHDRLQIAFVGRFDQEKNPDLFCQLSNELDYDFHFWGGGDLLDSYIEKYPKVNFHGLERNIDIIYRDMDILIMTSKVENCPMVILEAMSRGIPVIAPKVGGIPEIVAMGTTGYIYQKHTLEDISRSICYVKDNYDSMSRQCIEYSKKYSYLTISGDWDKLI